MSLPKFASVQAIKKDFEEGEIEEEEKDKQSSVESNINCFKTMEIVRKIIDQATVVRNQFVLQQILKRKRIQKEKAFEAHQGKYYH